MRVCGFVHLWVMQRVCLPGHADQIQMTRSELSSCPSPRARVTSLMQTALFLRSCRRSAPCAILLFTSDPVGSTSRDADDLMTLSPALPRPNTQLSGCRHRVGDTAAGNTSKTFLMPRGQTYDTQKDSFTHRLSEGARMACLDQLRIHDWSAQLPKFRPRNILSADNLSQAPL